MHHLLEEDQSVHRPMEEDQSVHRPLEENQGMHRPLEEDQSVHHPWRMTRACTTPLEEDPAPSSGRGFTSSPSTLHQTLHWNLKEIKQE